jgi:hypothetical protein
VRRDPSGQAEVKSLDSAGAYGGQQVAAAGPRPTIKPPPAIILPYEVNLRRSPAALLVGFLTPKQKFLIILAFTSHFCCSLCFVLSSQLCGIKLLETFVPLKVNEKPNINIIAIDLKHVVFIKSCLLLFTTSMKYMTNQLG